VPKEKNAPPNPMPALARDALRRVSKKGGSLVFGVEAQRAIEKKIRAAQSEPGFKDEVIGLARFAYLLANEKKSPDAGHALLGILERILQEKHGVMKTGWTK